MHEGNDRSNTHRELETDRDVDKHANDAEPYSPQSARAQLTPHGWSNVVSFLNSEGIAESSFKSAFDLTSNRVSVTRFAESNGVLILRALERLNPSPLNILSGESTTDLLTVEFTVERNEELMTAEEIGAVLLISRLDKDVDGCSECDERKEHAHKALAHEIDLRLG